MYLDEVLLFITLLLLLGSILTVTWKVNAKYLGIEKGARLIKIVFTISAFLIATYLSLNFRNIAASDWVTIALYIGLVGVTVIYAFATINMARAMKGQAEATKQQAEASIKMAEEMREAQSPRIIIRWSHDDLQNKNIGAYIENEGSSTALNLKCYLSHNNFTFKYKFDIYPTFNMKQKHTLSLPTEDFDFNEWNGLTINCDYSSIFGDHYRSFLTYESKDKRHFEIIKINNENNDD